MIDRAIDETLAAACRAPIVRIDGEIARPAIDELAEEEPLAIRVRGRAISVTMRTPGHDAELAVGFLFTEGVIRSPADVIRAEPCDRDDSGNSINVLLAPDVSVDFDRLTRHVFASSSCGICGRTTIDLAQAMFPQVTADLMVPSSLIANLPDVMRRAQATFDRTGGLHAAAIFDERGKLLVLREDVGRHNALDKIIGHGLLNRQLPFNRHVLLVSGRTSFEILQKSCAAGIPIVAAVSAPSSLAVGFAQASGQTLVGFLRGQRMNVYTHARRIVSGGGASA